MPFPYTHVLYDLDGTLIDHFNVIYRCYVHALQKLDQPVPDRETVVRTVGGSMEVTMRHFVEDSLHDAAVDYFREHFRAIFREEINPLPGVPEIPQALQELGCTQAVFTNKNGQAARAIIEHCGWTPYFALVVGSHDTAWRKPQVEFSQHILAALSADPATTCLVGDSPFDIEAAQVAGIDVYAVCTGTHRADELAAAGATGVFPHLPAWAEHFGVTAPLPSSSLKQ